jgi:uncharacterized protein (TIGR00251 family)
MGVNLRQRNAGVELMVKASPGSRKNEIRGVVDGALKISVTAVAEKGKANAAIVKLLSSSLGIAKSRIELSSGATASVKKFIVQDIELAVLEEQLSDLIAGKRG